MLLKCSREFLRDIHLYNTLGHCLGLMSYFILSKTPVQPQLFQDHEGTKFLINWEMVGVSTISIHLFKRACFGKTGKPVEIGGIMTFMRNFCFFGDFGEISGTGGFPQKTESPESATDEQ